MFALLIGLALAGGPDDKTSWNDLPWSSAPPAGAKCEAWQFDVAFCVRPSNSLITAVGSEKLMYWRNSFMASMIAMPYRAETFDAMNGQLARLYGPSTKVISGGFGWQGKNILIALVTDSKLDEIHINYYYMPLYSKFQATHGTISGGL